MEVPLAGYATCEEADIAFHVFAFMGGRLMIGQDGFNNFYHTPGGEARG